MPILNKWFLIHFRFYPEKGGLNGLQTLVERKKRKTFFMAWDKNRAKMPHNLKLNLYSLGTENKTNSCRSAKPMYDK